MDKKAGLQMMIAAGMAMAAKPPRGNWNQRRKGGKCWAAANPDKKTKRRIRQASRRNNRKK